MNTNQTNPTRTLRVKSGGEIHTFETCGCATDISDRVYEIIDDPDRADNVALRLIGRTAPCETH